MAKTKPSTVQIKILRNTRLDGQSVSVGDTATTSPKNAAILCALGKAEPYAAPVKPAPVAKKKAAAKAPPKE